MSYWSNLQRDFTVPPCSNMMLPLSLLANPTLALHWIGGKSGETTVGECTSLRSQKTIFKNLRLRRASEKSARPPQGGAEAGVFSCGQLIRKVREKLILRSNLYCLQTCNAFKLMRISPRSIEHWVSFEQFGFMFGWERCWLKGLHKLKGIYIYIQIGDSFMKKEWLARFCDLFNGRLATYCLSLSFL